MKVKPKEPRISGNETETPQRRVKGAHIKYDEHGRELMDPTPMAPPIGYRKAPSITDQIRNMIRSEHLAREAASAGYESFEEADDFDIDDFDPTSPYEEVFEPLPQDDGTERLKTLGDHIGDRIFSKLGGEQPLPPTEQAPAETSPQPPGSGRREPPAAKPSPAPGPTSDAAGNLARGSLKPRAT